MNLNIGDTLNGFLLINKEKIEDIKSVGYLFEHKKSGARLIFMENDDTFFTSRPGTVPRQSARFPPALPDNRKRP